MISFSVVTFCTGWNINYLNDCTQYLFIVSCRIIFPKPFLNYNVNMGSSGCSPSWMSAPDNTKKTPEFFIILFIHACWFLRYVIYGLFQHHFLLLRRYRKNSSPNARGRCEENQKALCSQSSKKISQNVFLKKTVSGMTRMFSTQLSSTLFVQVIISFLQLLVYQSQRIFTDHIILN